MNAETMKQLKKISKPKQFAKDEYICYEGQPGSEMYIILKGSIGVYVTSAIGTLTEIAQIQQGNFFGEMALFDNLPRSASCIALEDTLCVAINKNNLTDFLMTCPEMTEKILENLSARIRKLNNDLYKSTDSGAEKYSLPKFAIPKEYSFSHVVKEPYQNPRVMTQYTQKCPVCGRAVSVTNLKRHMMPVKQMNMDSRIEYLMCDPLWYDIISCPNCYYANHHLQFFKLHTAAAKKVHTLLNEQHVPVVEQKDVKRTSFDKLVLKYLQAIHINEYINPKDNITTGTLWLNLYWLAKDSGDDKFTLFCAGKSVEKLQKALDGEEIEDEVSKCSLAMSLASLLIYTEKEENALKYCTMALECSDERIQENAKILKEKLSV